MVQARALTNRSPRDLVDHNPDQDFPFNFNCTALNRTGPIGGTSETFSSHIYLVWGGTGSSLVNLLDGVIATTGCLTFPLNDASIPSNGVINKDHKQAAAFIPAKVHAIKEKSVVIWRWLLHISGEMYWRVAISVSRCMERSRHPRRWLIAANQQLMRGLWEPAGLRLDNNSDCWVQRS